MPKNPSAVPKPATGFVGFGCGFILSMAGLFFSVLPETPLGVWAVVGAAILLGLVTARLGEPFFEKLVAFFSW
jgi:hypothetical protein